MSSDVTHRLAQWTRAGVIDEATAERIREFERARVGSARMHWPVLIALAFGALTVGAGVLLFVSAHWDTLSPQARFTLVLVLVSIFHVSGALAADRFPAMATALHAVGTVALGAGIYLAGQIFHLDEHWPGGLMLWSIGAAVAAVLLRDPAQVALVSALAPAWLAAEWIVASQDLRVGLTGEILGCGLFLIALAYFTSIGPERPAIRRRVVAWVGVLALPPLAVWLAIVANDRTRQLETLPPSAVLLAVGWTVALGVPLAVSGVLRGRAAWPMGLAIAWSLALVLIVAPFAPDAAFYFWWAVAAVGLAAWGVQDSRPGRVNMGAAMFAVTLLTYYFSHVMDKLARSASLIVLGGLFLVGGWALERVRRRLVEQARGTA